MKNFNKEELIYLKELVLKNGFAKIDLNIFTLIKKIDTMLEIYKNNEIYLYQFYWDFGRAGSVQGVFKATAAEVENAIGKYIYLGDVLGKHSDVSGTLKEEDFEILETDPLNVAVATESGFNPLEYIEEE